MLKKGQSTVETVLVLGIIMVVLIALFSFNINLWDSLNLENKVTQIRSAADDLANAVNMVYSEGLGSRTRVFIKIPDFVKDINISNQQIIIETYSGDRTIRSFGFDVFGTINVSNGDQYVLVESYGNYVNVSFIEDIEEVTVCGDGVKEGTEECDGTDFGGYTCQDYGYSSGNLLCNSDCSVNVSQCTAGDSTPPGTVTGLINISNGINYITWTWNDPSDLDFDHTEVWLNGTFMENSTDEMFNATGLDPYTWYEIELRTVDTTGNINTTWVTNSAQTMRPFTIEWGSINASTSWTNVDLNNHFYEPVIITSGNQNTNTNSFVVRLSNVTGDNFEIRIQNPRDLSLSSEKVYYLVVEEGNWTLSNGTKIEAYKYLSNVLAWKNSWVGESKNYTNSYANPVTVASVMSNNDSDWQATTTWGNSRSNPPSSSDLVISRHVAEDTDHSRNYEIVGYVIFESGHHYELGTEIEAKIGTDTVRGLDNSPPFSYTFDQSFSNQPEVALVCGAGLDGGDGGWANTYGSNDLSSTQIDLVFDEDQIGDSERSHTTEQIGYIVFGNSGGYSEYDKTPPGTVTDLVNSSQGLDYITWTWNDPSDTDFNHTEVWLNGTFMENTTDETYNAAGLNQGTWYEIELRTVDNSGNVNTTWVKHSAKTYQIKNIKIKPQKCVAEDQSNQDAWNKLCAGTYPGDCPDDLLSCLDAEYEKKQSRRVGWFGQRYAGVRTTNYNTTESCHHLLNVSVCYNWFADNSYSANCYIAVDGNGDGTFTDVLTDCPPTLATLNTKCIDVTSADSFTCGSFFDPAGTDTQIKSEVGHASSGSTTTIYWDVLYYNVTYY